MPTDRLFTSQSHAQTGLYFYNARYYDATIGRFISPDTIIPNPANPQSFNRYSYCLNNPMKYIDPSGNSYLEDLLMLDYLLDGGELTEEILDSIYTSSSPSESFTISSPKNMNISFIGNYILLNPQGWGKYQGIISTTWGDDCQSATISIGMEVDQDVPETSIAFPSFEVNTSDASHRIIMNYHEGEVLISPGTKYWRWQGSIVIPVASLESPITVSLTVNVLTNGNVDAPTYHYVIKSIYSVTEWTIWEGIE